MFIAPPTEKEKECVKHLQKNFPTSLLDPEDASFLDDTTYLRFARARDGNKEKASEMLKAAIEWRKSYKPYTITADDVRKVMSQMTMTCGGCCKANRPILVMTLSVPNECDAADRIKQLVYILEETQRKGYDCITWIVDFSEMGKHKSDAASKETRKSTMQILQDYYPERLGLMLLYRTPWYVRWSIMFVKPFLDSRTRAKIFLAGQTAKDLEQYAALTELPVRLGGKMEAGGLEALTDLPPFKPDENQPPAAIVPEAAAVNAFA